MKTRISDPEGFSSGHSLRGSFEASPPFAETRRTARPVRGESSEGVIPIEVEVIRVQVMDLT